MRQIVGKLRSSTFLRHNAIFFVGSLAVGALNYLYYPALGRVLDPATFGEVQALVSLFLQLVIFLTVLGLITVNVVANYESEARRNQVIFEFEKLALYISLVALAAVIIFSPQLKSFLNFNDTWPFIILMLSIVATVPLTFRGSFLRGKQQFGLSSLATLLGAAGKLVGSLVLVWIGWGAGGAIAGIAMAQILASLYASHHARRFGLRRQDGDRRFSLPNFGVLLPELTYGCLVLIGSLFITLQYSVDIIVIKHFFDAETAGLYAGISSVARIIFFLTSSIALVLLPSVKLKQTNRQNQALLLKSLGLLLLVGLPALLLFMVAPELVVRVLMGQAYSEFTGLLPRLSLAIFVISILNLFVSYYVALRRYTIALIVIIGAVLTYGLMWVHHQTPGAVVDSLLFGSVCMIGLLVLWGGLGKLLKILGGTAWQRSSLSQ